VRVWDLPPSCLCRKHLLAQHNEIHGLWTVLTQHRIAYANHPETRRWRGRLLALSKRHEETSLEMLARGYNHNSPLDEALATGDAEQPDYVDTPERQQQLLREKGCECRPEQSAGQA
jgi:hypothetical protein